ncbi:MAG: c-type cytochrome domain-containing protein [Planctomycetota bacterium]
MVEGAQEGGRVFGTEQWLEFIGHLHPVVLHMPIGLLAASLLVEFVSLFSRGAVPARRVLHACLGISALAAVVTGWLLADTGGYGSELVDHHRALAIVAAVLAVVVGLVDLFGRDGTATFARRLALLACALTMTLAGHNGGMITHGRTFLSAVAPPELAPWLGEAPKERQRTRRAADPVPTEGPAEGSSDASRDAVDAPSAAPQSDVTVLVAAFRERCFECHREDKIKGDLRLDVVSGWPDQVDLESPEDSELLYRVLLPRDDADAMPPKGDALAPEAIEALRRWIEAGAPMDELERELSGASADERQAAADLDGIRAATGARIAPIAADLDRPAAAQRLDVSWRHVDAEPDAARLEALAPVSDRVVELDLAGRRAAAAALTALPPMAALERLHLERTGVDSDGVRLVCEAAPGLRYVNLHSTAVCGEALGPLGGLERLRRLVLFDSGVTPGELAAFAERRPGVRVTLDGGLPEGLPFVAGQPRRILAADPEEGRVALLREVAIGHPEVLWERTISDLRALEWRGDTAGGHGRVLLAQGTSGAEVIDTASDQVLSRLDVVDVSQGPGPADPPLLANGNRVEARSCTGPEDPQLVETTPDGDVAWTFHDRERFRSAGALFVVLDGGNALSIPRGR